MGLFSNPRLWLGIGVEVGVLIAVILVPPLSAIFHTAPLSFSEYGVLLAMPPLMLLLEETRKWLVRRAR